MRWALVIGLMTLMAAPSSLPGDTTTTMPSVRTVDAGELGTKVEVIGPFGQPLGKVVTIEGVPVDVSKRDDYWSQNVAENLFTVDTVDGVGLKQPGEIQLRFADSRKLPLNKRAAFKGYQTGQFVNVPEAAKSKDNPLQSNGWHFEVWFIVTDDHVDEHRLPDGK